MLYQMNNVIVYFKIAVAVTLGEMAYIMELMNVKQYFPSLLEEKIFQSSRSQIKMK